MENFLALPDKAKDKEVAAKIADLSRADLDEMAVKLYKVAQIAKHATPTKVLGGSILGWSVGETINAILFGWAKSGLPLSGFIAEYYTPARTIPALALGIIGMLTTKDMDTSGKVLGYCASVGLVGPALSRFLDWLAYEGDLNYQEEQKLKARVAELEAQLAKK